MGLTAYKKGVKMSKKISLGLINNRVGKVVDKALYDDGYYDPEVEWDDGTGTGQVWADGDSLYARISDSADGRAAITVADAAIGRKPSPPVIFDEFQEALMAEQSIDPEAVRTRIENARASQ